jgi:hypothetical protein
LAVFFFKPIPPSQLDGLGEGMAEDKISVPACTETGRTGTVAPPEPWPDPGLPTKEATKEKETNHQKEVRSLQKNMDRHFDYTPTGDESRTVIFLLTFKKLYHIAI